MAREMKDSGNARVGSIPIHWKIGRLKHVAQLYTGNSIKDDEKELYGDPIDAIPYISSKDIDATFLTANYSNGMYVKKNDLTFKIAPAGSLLMCIEGGSAGRKKTRLSQSVAFVNKLCCFNPAKINGDFLYYWICSPNFEDEFKENISGLIGGVSVSSLQNFTIALPSSTEQMRIASFLDRKCAEIDSVIADTQRTIEEYKKLKQSVITQAVTKGIRGERPMKDSGIEWIGEIPVDWAVVKLNRIADGRHPYAIGDGDHGLIKPADYQDNGIPYIRVQNLGWATEIDTVNIVYISEETNNRIESSTLRPNDVLFAKTGATIGKTGIVPETMTIANTTSHVGKITVDKKYNPRFVFYALSSDVGYRQFWSYAIQKTTRPELAIDEIKAVRVALPLTTQEQIEIVEYLDSKCAELDKLITAKTHLLEELEVYKKSVIYEYVTGKKEVPACQ